MAVATAVATTAGGAVGAGPSPAADRALAKRITLHLSDLPPGWRTESVPKGSSTCKATRWFKSSETAKAQTAFTNELAHVASTAAIFPTTAVSKRAFTDYANNLRACALQLQANKLSIKTISVPRFGDQSKAWSVRASAQGVDLALDIFLARIGRIDALYEFGGVGKKAPLHGAKLVRRATARA
jgi:hypothetical protein